MENYLEAKAKLFEISKNSVLNADEAVSEKLLKHACGRVITYAVNNKADLSAENVVLKPDRVEFTAVYEGKSLPAVLHIPGKYNVYNALAAISCCIALGFKLEEIIEAMKGSQSVRGRLEVVPTGRDFTVLIDYAVTPDALDSMIRTVRQTALGRVGVLFGCGGEQR
jgi:UDP-N-acetylmuramoyl-L-alanyl-D-glutamate--2,6-diaminopimelate ligase